MNIIFLLKKRDEAKKWRSILKKIHHTEKNSTVKGYAVYYEFGNVFFLDLDANQVIFKTDIISNNCIDIVQPEYLRKLIHSDQRLLLGAEKFESLEIVSMKILSAFQLIEKFIDVDHVLSSGSGDLLKSLGTSYFKKASKRIIYSQLLNKDGPGFFVSSDNECYALLKLKSIQSTSTVKSEYRCNYIADLRSKKAQILTKNISAKIKLRSCINLADFGLTFIKYCFSKPLSLRKKNLATRLQGYINYQVCKLLTLWLKNDDRRVRNGSKFLFLVGTRNDAKTTLRAEDTSLIKILRKVFDDIPTAKVDIRPHPGDIGSISVIDALYAYKNRKQIGLLNNKLPLNDIIDEYDALIAINSSAAIEALLKDKTIISFGKSFLNSLPNVMTLENFVVKGPGTDYSIDPLLDLFDYYYCSQNGDTETERHELIAKIIESIIDEV